MLKKTLNTQRNRKNLSNVREFWHSLSDKIFCTLFHVQRCIIFFINCWLKCSNDLINCYFIIPSRSKISEICHTFPFSKSSLCSWNFVKSTEIFVTQGFEGLAPLGLYITLPLSYFQWGRCMTSRCVSAVMRTSVLTTFANISWVLPLTRISTSTVTHNSTAGKGRHHVNSLSPEDA